MQTSFNEKSHMMGIESEDVLGVCDAVGVFQWEIPYDGNWKLIIQDVPGANHPVSMRNPIWCELKGDLFRTRWEKSPAVSMRNPIWWELKDPHHSLLGTYKSPFQWEIPYDGNWKEVGSTSTLHGEVGFNEKSHMMGIERLYRRGISQIPFWVSMRNPIWWELKAYLFVPLKPFLSIGFNEKSHMMGIER